MTVETYLLQVKDIDLRIRSLQGELYECRRDGDEAYVKELESSITANIEKYQSLKLRIRDEIQSLDDNRYVTLLSEYYVKGKSWEDVTEALGKKDTKHVRTTLHERALKSFSEKFSKFF